MKQFSNDSLAVKRALNDYRWAIFLFVLSVFMLFMLLAEWGVMSWRDKMLLARLDEKPPQAAQPPAVKGPVASDLLPMESYAQTVERPVFMEGRKPGLEPWLSLEQGTKTTQGPLSLTGVVLSPGGEEALLTDDQHHTKRLKKGESWNGWTLQGVYPDHAVIEQRGDRQDIRLHTKKKP
ncbi:hypothetical protein F6R98_06175 [Candidatus Methylospira mobilis]|uniref:Type II secretion system protein GspC N-terminal domain-containing protein n=1 Tax=Candidatus Methylospira mobilis TaxID=1808979 RepID=A0A5Q0BEH1_9GAMM|nr:hypothetical protein [Candidatus Methylospira mobilis]QFY42265.1 hypothetical protein F6R98_06175 [Candidatus Methylospira mobilis]